MVILVHRPAIDDGAVFVGHLLPEKVGRVVHSEPRVRVRVLDALLVDVSMGAA